MVKMKLEIHGVEIKANDIIEIKHCTQILKLGKYYSKPIDTIVNLGRIKKIDYIKKQIELDCSDLYSSNIVEIDFKSDEYIINIEVIEEY